jgi:hypothetical protein
MLYPSGNVIIKDDFEDSKEVYYLSGDTGGSIALDTTTYFSGIKSLKLTTASGTGKTYSFTRFLGSPPTQKIGIEIHFSGPEGWNGYTEFHINSLDGTNNVTAKIRYGNNLNKWQYWTSAGAWADVSGGSMDLSIGALIFHHFKMVVDLENSKYVGFYIDNEYFDLSTTSTQSSASTAARRMYFRVWCENIDNDTLDWNFDDLIITEEE